MQHLCPQNNTVKQGSRTTKGSENCSCDEDNNLHASDLRSFRNDQHAVAEGTKKSANQMSEILSSISSEINQTVMKLSNKQDLSLMKESENKLFDPETIKSPGL